MTGDVDKPVCDPDGPAGMRHRIVATANSNDRDLTRLA
jgi:hypothetical protein